MKQQKARHVGEGVALGFRDFGVGIYKAITGVITAPIEGGQKEGALGVLKGVGKGITGLVVKPTIGAIDLVTRTAEGIKNTTTILDDNIKARVRPPRYFAPDATLRVYDLYKSIGQELMSVVDDGKFKGQFYAYHVTCDVEPDKGMIAIITQSMLLCISRKHMMDMGLGATTVTGSSHGGVGGTWRTKWSLELREIGSLDVRNSSLKITHSNRAKRFHDSNVIVMEVTDKEHFKTFLHTFRKCLKQAGGQAFPEIVAGGPQGAATEVEESQSEEDEVEKRRKKLAKPRGHTSASEKQPLIQKEEPPCCECGCTLL